MRPHAFAYKMCADFPAPVSTDRPIVLGWAARSLATGISWYGKRAASGAGVSSYKLSPSEPISRPTPQTNGSENDPCGSFKNRGSTYSIGDFLLTDEQQGVEELITSTCQRARP